MSETETSAPAATPAPTHTRAGERRKVVTIEWPVEYEGKIYTEIELRRPSVAEVRDWSARMAAAVAAGRTADSVVPPIFAAPDAVINALDPDDDDLLTEAGRPFLPRIFRAEERG